MDRKRADKTNTRPPPTEKTVSSPSDTADAPNPTALELFRARVRQKAFELFEQHGKRGDHALDDWLEAERLVREEMTKKN